MEKIKIREGDLKRTLELLNKECPGEFVYISVNFPVLTLVSYNKNNEKLEIQLKDDAYYSSPKKIKEEPF
ncbi:MAG TPA: hypothetical protein VIL26_04445 [Clostridia bacterium]